jgi:hypothetical protein
MRCHAMLILSVCIIVELKNSDRCVYRAYAQYQYAYAKLTRGISMRLLNMRVMRIDIQYTDPAHMHLKFEYLSELFCNIIQITRNPYSLAI